MTPEEINQLMKNSMDIVNNNPVVIEAKRRAQASVEESVKNVQHLQDFAIIVNEAKKAAADLQANRLPKTKMEEQQLEQNLLNSIKQKLSGEYEYTDTE